MLLKRNNIWHVRKMVGGVMLAKSTKTSNKKLAEQIAAKWVSELHSEVVVAGRRPVTLEKAIAAFLESRKGTAGHGSAEVKLRPFKKFNTRYLHEIPASDIRSLAVDMVDDGYSIATVNVSLVYYNAVMNFAAASGFTPGAKVKRLKGQTGKLRFLSDEEIAALLKALDPESGVFREKRKAQDNFDFVRMLLHTGSRENEMANLSLNQIDHKAGTISIKRSKGGTDTTLRINSVMREIVTRRIAASEEPLKGGQSLHGRAANGFLFPERAGSRYNNEWFVKACFRAGLKGVNLHTLRHTACVKWLRGGLSLTDCQHLLGHRNIQSTFCYAHVSPGLAADRAALILDNL